MKLTVSDINWFIPGAPENMDTGLPKQVVITDPILLPELLKDINNEAVNLTEWLTQKYGCLVTGFSIDMEREE